LGQEEYVGVRWLDSVFRRRRAVRARFEGWKTCNITITPGDLFFDNGVQATEEGDGPTFVNPQGKKIAVLHAEANLQAKGKITESPNL